MRNDRHIEVEKADVGLRRSGGRPSGSWTSAIALLTVAFVVAGTASPSDARFGGGMRGGGMHSSGMGGMRGSGQHYSRQPTFRPSRSAGSGFGHEAHASNFHPSSSYGSHPFGGEGKGRGPSHWSSSSDGNGTHHATNSYPGDKGGRLPNNGPTTGNGNPPGQHYPGQPPGEGKWPGRGPIVGGNDGPPRGGRDPYPGEGKPIHHEPVRWNGPYPVATTPSQPIYTPPYPVASTPAPASSFSPSSAASGHGTPMAPQPAMAPAPSAPRRASSGQLMPNEARFVPNEVLLVVRDDVTEAMVGDLAQRHHLVPLTTQRIGLVGATLRRCGIRDGRSVSAVLRGLEADQQIAWTQPNYIFKLEGDVGHPGGLSAAQYALARMHLPEAHRVTLGDSVRVAVIDSGIDQTHPELAGAIADSYDAIGPGPAEAHGTAIAGIIGAHAELTGVAPHAKILAIRAFSDRVGAPGAEGTSAHIIAGIQWAYEHNARIINMSFAGPRDPLMAQELANARNRGAILIAAAGNEGPGAAPLYPAADPNVIAVTATDAQNHLYAGANRGSYIRLAAPGTDILVAAPQGTYQFNTGTSMAAAHISGVAALLLSVRPDLGTDAVRAILTNTSQSLPITAQSQDDVARLGDAYAALGSVVHVEKSNPVAAPAPSSAPHHAVVGSLN